MRALILAALLVATPALAQPRTDKPQSIWRTEADGAVEHLQSGLRCPKALGEFTQGDIVAYEGYGFDVGCGFSGRRGAITVYLTKLPGLDAARSYEGAKLAVGQNALFAGARELSDGPVQQGGLQWRRAVYATDALRSEVWVADLHGWVLKYRATYPPADAADVARQLEAMTEIARTSAGARLGACARSQPPDRRGRPARSRGDQSDALMGALLGGVAAAAAQEKGAEVTPIIYCPEGPIERMKVPMLMWRGVRPDGSLADSDRVTAMSVGRPPTLDSTADTLGSIVNGEIERRAPRPRWVATLQEGGRTTIYGYYDGRPAPASLGLLLQDVLDGKAKPLGSYSLDGNTVNIGIPTRK